MRCGPLRAGAYVAGTGKPAAGAYQVLAEYKDECQRGLLDRTMVLDAPTGCSGCPHLSVSISKGPGSVLSDA